MTCAQKRQSFAVSQGQICSSSPQTGDAGQCLGTFLVVTTGEDAPGICWAETGYAAKILQLTRQPLIAEGYPSPNANSAEVQKPSDKRSRNGWCLLERAVDHTER